MTPSASSQLCPVRPLAPGRATPRFGPALIVFILGLLLSFAAWRVAIINQHDVDRQGFARLTERLTGILSERLRNYQKGLAGAQGLYAASKSVERGEWKTYVSALKMEREFPGAEALGFTAFVRRADLPAFLETTRKDESPWFEAKPAREDNDLFVVKYIEPQERNQAVLGWDFSQDPVRLAAFDRAMITGEPSLTAKVTLLQDVSARPAIVCVHPVYHNGLPHRTESERAAAIQGWVFAPLIIENLMTGLFEAGEGLIDIEMFDATESSGQAALYRSDAGTGTAFDANPSFKISSDLVHAGRRWTSLDAALRFQSEI